jgi:hypothetical protein
MDKHPYSPTRSLQRVWTGAPPAKRRVRLLIRKQSTTAVVDVTPTSGDLVHGPVLYSEQQPLPRPGANPYSATEMLPSLV